MKFNKKLVYTAHSSTTIDKSEQIILFVLKKGYVPLDPFTVLAPETLDKLGLDKLDRLLLDTILLSYSDELWVFGEVSEGVSEEVFLWLNGKTKRPPIKYISWEELEGDNL